MLTLVAPDPFRSFATGCSFLARPLREAAAVLTSALGILIMLGVPVLLPLDAREDFASLGVDNSFSSIFGASAHSLNGGSFRAFEAGVLFLRPSCLRNRL